MTAAIEIAASLILAAFVSWLVVRQHRGERAEVAAAETSACTCDMFDIGPRCDFCVSECSREGHPFVEALTNGQHHMCGVIL